ncbi:hypothetical protein [Methylorubrum extorquens]
MSGYGTGTSSAQVAAAIEAASVVLPGEFTVDTLPPPALNLDRYARVTDLFGIKRDLVLASMAGPMAFWQPVRPVFSTSRAVAGSMTLTPLKTPSVLYLTGNLPGNTSITLSQSLAYPGASFEIAFDGSLGLFSFNLIGLNGGGLLSLLAGSRRRVFWDLATASWKQFS